ncbi:NAD(P)/FAD-dependent oxidoreductase [Streptomyces sp. NPDC049585]|uniref:flavin monoamine oxidase family protein n=1 Tax=Streptomyces sp. NPDC049585 TaxID=3155154 RepID=UPI00343E262D
MHADGPGAVPADDSPLHAGPAGRPGRRRVLKAIGAGAAAVSFGAMGAGTARADEEQFTDVVVIGAGYAGGTVARELGAKGLTSIVLEARDRIGGRIWTTTMAGEQIELGGQWVSPSHRLVNAELARYGIGIVRDPDPERIAVARGGRLEHVAPAEAAALLEPLWKEFYKGSEQYFERPAEPLYRKDLLAAVDPLSVADRLRQMNLSPAERDLISGDTAAYCGGSLQNGSLTGMAQWYQLSGGTYDSYSTTIGSRPAGGMTALLQAMLQDSGARVRLNSPVAKVTQSGSRVVVETRDGRRYAARTVVVATPANVWRNITFAPGLPPAHARAAAQGIGLPSGTKMLLHVKGEVEAVGGTASEGSPILMMVPQKQLADGRLVVAFPSPQLNVADPVQVQQAVRQWIPGAQVLASRAMEWGKDPFSAGSWGFRRPGQLLGLFPQIEQPHGRILFAGADIAQGWHGAYIEGAVESGRRAAQQALQLLA